MITGWINKDNTFIYTLNHNQAVRSVGYESSWKAIEDGWIRVIEMSGRYNLLKADQVLGFAMAKYQDEKTLVRIFNFLLEQSGTTIYNKVWLEKYDPFDYIVLSMSDIFKFGIEKALGKAQKKLLSK